MSQILKVNHIKQKCVGYSRSEFCCKQNIVFTPILRSLSTSSGVWWFKIKIKEVRGPNYTWQNWIIRYP